MLYWNVPAVIDSTAQSLDHKIIYNIGDMLKLLKHEIVVLDSVAKDCMILNLSCIPMYAGLFQT